MIFGLTISPVAEGSPCAKKCARSFSSYSWPRGITYCMQNITLTTLSEVKRSRNLAISENSNSLGKKSTRFLRIDVFAFSRHKINRNDPDVENIYWNLWPVEFYRMLQYKHFEVWLVVPWFTVLKMITRLFFFPVLLNYRSVSQQRTTYLMTSFPELSPGYKKSTLTFLLCQINPPDGLVHECKEKHRAHFFALRDPLTEA